MRYEAVMAIAPAIHHFLPGVTFINEPTASDFPPRPSENSAIITGIPNINTQAIYTNRNAAPPLLCANTGNRHTFPRPTADPTVAAMSPNLVANCVLFDMRNL